MRVLKRVSIEDINLNDHRFVFSYPLSYQRLYNSIKEIGLISPVLLRGEGSPYQVIDGLQRILACQKARVPSIEALIYPEDSLDELGGFHLAIHLNIHNRSLNPIEKARAFWELIEVFGLTQETVGKYVGMDRSSVANFLRLLELAMEVQEHVSRGTISSGHARALLAARDEAVQKKLCQRILDEGLTVRQVEVLASSVKRNTQRSRQNGKSNNHCNTRELEDKLSLALGTKVQICHRGGKGKIIIHFNGNPHFEDLRAKLCRG